MGRFCKWDVFFAPAECFGTETMLFTVSSFNCSFNDFMDDSKPQGGGFSTNEDDGDETCKARAKRKILGKYDFSKTVNHPFLGTWMYQELSKW